MQLYKSVFAALAIGSLAVGGCGTESSKDDQGSESQSARQLGELGMALSLPDDSQVTSVNYSITGPGGFIRNGVVPVGNSSKLAFRVGNLPIQNGYTIALGATTSFGEPCQGSQTFNILNNQTTSVTVLLLCQATDDEADLIVDGQFQSCPLVTTLQAIPAEVYVGSSMAFTAGISHGDSDVTWSAADGTFAPAVGYNTTYTCTTPGTKTITAAITGLGAACSDFLTMTVECTQSINCGDGVLSGTEQCDDGNTVDTDACRNNCFINVCGDAVLNTGVEQCDASPLPTATCDAACHTIACGDGVVGGTEQCDDGNTVNTDGCSNTCRLPGCGDGILQAGEQCDDNNLVATDACTDICHNAVCGDGIVQAGVEQCDTAGATATCSATCTTIAALVRDVPEAIPACKTCRQTACTDYEASDVYNACFNPTTGGAAAIQLCVDLRNCMYNSNNGYTSVGPITSFCGSADPSTTCLADFAASNGPCKSAWFAAVGLPEVASNLSAFFGLAGDPANPAGAANYLTRCDTDSCAACVP